MLLSLASALLDQDDSLRWWSIIMTQVDEPGRSITTMFQDYASGCWPVVAAQCDGLGCWPFDVDGELDHPRSWSPMAAQDCTPA